METHTFPYQRVIVVGTTGSGKSTLAEKISRKFGLKLIELDALHWLPGWKHVPDQEFLEKVEAATCDTAWVIAGNYSVTRDLTWAKAQVVIWLDYSLWVIFWQLWHRTWRRWWTQELLWGTNREHMWNHLKIWSEEDSLFRWLFATYWRRKREYPKLFAQPEFNHLQIIHLRNRRETEQWFSTNQPPPADD